MSQEFRATHERIHLKDYQAPPYFIDHVSLDFDIFEDHTIVSSTMQIYRNQKIANADTPLILEGHHLELISLHLDGKEIDGQVTDHSLCIQNPPEKFELSTKVRITPQTNKAMEGLYKSGDMFCTQCEAEGFRRITYFVDRPDNMALYKTTIRANKAQYPILLSNGNKLEEKILDDGRHMVTWEDPFRKPSYLFALVAGDLDFVEDTFISQSKKKILLQVYVNKGQTNRANFAIEALQKSMRWDEFRYGLEYDLDIYMIVATDDFNMGAMENKGLNIFNSKYVLANPQTATDSDYQSIESIIGHEYFHNWTGNRVTCRDWFQLSLKEGLTVYRDQEFTADHFSRTVTRIENVQALRSRQFQEDAGPNAHPVRPSSCVSVDNFYTSTVYDKGAELIRMIEQLIGRDNFRKGIDKYFELYDGQAVTIDDFIHAMSLASGFDFTQFKLWYEQAGTPKIKITDQFNETNSTYSLHIEQTVPPTPGHPDKQPMLIPLKMGLIDSDGYELAIDHPEILRRDDDNSVILTLKATNQSFHFNNIPKKPIPSLFRDFSAPIKLEYDYSDDELIHLMTYDKNLFNRWEACQKYFINEFQLALRSCETSTDYHLSDKLKTAFIANIEQANVDPLYTSNILSLPNISYLKQFQKEIHPHVFVQAYSLMEKRIGIEFEKLFLKTYAHYHTTKNYAFNEIDASHRYLKNKCLYFLTATGNEDYFELAHNQFNESQNMTDQIGALSALNHHDHELRRVALQDFYDKWCKDKVVFNKYISFEALTRLPMALKNLQNLIADPHFNETNPNNIYASIRAFASANLNNFHHNSGQAYTFVADHIIRIDAFNPQVAARLAEAFEDWRSYSPTQQDLIKEQLLRIKAVKNLSNNSFEIIERALKS